VPDKKVVNFTIVMNNPLDGARLKVVRAKKHLASFNNDTDRYYDKDAYPVSVGARRKPDGWEVFPGFRTPPPMELSAPIGDCLCCIRTSLDYIAWELAGRFVGRALVPGRDKIYFPTITDPNAWPDVANSLTKYSIPKNVIDIIRDVQPYNAGYEPIKWLTILVNEDKHRFPVLVRCFAETFDVTINYGGNAVGRNDGKHKTFIPDTVLPPGNSADDLTLDGQITTFIAFDNSGVPRQPADDTLEAIIGCVDAIIPQFDVFLLIPSCPREHQSRQRRILRSSLMQRRSPGMKNGYRLQVTRAPTKSRGRRLHGVPSSQWTSLR
jgi:hypothetical protein